MHFILLFVILLAGAIFPAVVRWYPAVDWLQEDYLRLGWPGLIVALAVIILASGRLRRPTDPGIVGWMAFGFAGCFLLAPLLVAKHQQEVHDLDQQERLAALQEQVAANFRKIEQKKLEALEKEIPEGSSDRFARYRGKIDALTLGKLRLLDARMENEVKGRAEGYKQALADNPTAGPNSWLTFRTREALEAELEAHRTLYAATRSFTDFIESFEETYTAAIEEAELKPPGDRIAIAEMERILQSWERNNTYEVRKLDVLVLGAAINALQILDNEWGLWSYSPRDEQITFENTAKEREFIEAIQQLQTAGEEVRKLTNSEN